MRRKYQITRNRVQLQNRLESLLEEAHIKVSSLVSDLLGVSARRMLPRRRDGRNRIRPRSPRSAARACVPRRSSCAMPSGPRRMLHPVYRRLLAMTLEELGLIEAHLRQLDQEMADLLRVHQDAVQRLAEVPGLGVDSAQQIIAEVGPHGGRRFPTAKHLASWMGACPGNEESAGVNYSHRFPNGNRQMRRLLNQAANAAVKTKGTIFELRLSAARPPPRPCPGDRRDRAPAVSTDLEDSARARRYEERGPAVSQARASVAPRKMIRELRSLGYRVELIAAPSGNAL